MTTYSIPQPPDDIFLYRHEKLYDIQNEGQITYMLDHIEYDNGIRVFHPDAKYPRKGFPTADALWSCGVIKRLFILLLKLPLWILIFTPKLAIEELKHFNEIGYKLLKHHILKLHMMTPVAKELHICIKTFLVHLGVEKAIAYETACILSHLVEYDDAYRYRIQDLFTESSKEALLKSPIKEIKRLRKLQKERDSQGIVDKFDRFAIILTVLLLIPKVRKAFDYTLRCSMFDKLQRDEADTYWILNRSDYKYMGMSYDERIKLMDPVPQGYRVTHD